MPIEDYATLSAAVQSFMLDRTDLAAPMDSLVMLAEQAIFYGMGDMEPLRCREMETGGPLVPSDAGVCSLPDDYLQWRTVSEVIGYNIRGELQFVAPSARIQMYPNSVGGSPKHFTIIESLLITSPHNSNSIELIYYALPSALDPTVGTSSNAILVKYPSIYLRATCAMASEWMKQDAEMQKQMALLKAMIGAINKQGQMDVLAKTGVSFRRQVR